MLPASPPITCQARNDTFAKIMSRPDGYPGKVFVFDPGKVCDNGPDTLWYTLRV